MKKLLLHVLATPVRMLSSVLTRLSTLLSKLADKIDPPVVTTVVPTSSS